MFSTALDSGGLLFHVRRFRNRVHPGSLPCATWLETECILGVNHVYCVVRNRVHPGSEPCVLRG